MTVIVGYHCSLRSDRRTDMDSLLAFISFTQEAEGILPCKFPCTVYLLECLVLFVTYSVATFITALVRSTREGNIFSLFVCSHLEGGGYLPSRWGEGYLPFQVQMGVPTLAGGVPTLAKVGGYLPSQVGGTYPGRYHPTRVGTPQPE